ncbi:cyclopropane-fatty-acyl-phospholipid synthase family protein [Amycolatopsis acidiphila]|uniref:Class I SAM-dependent methyltransferase n=1 Tax=Amycolatopsis acidiphila TaxID=715473 RepID=A0A558AE88_9PSEU|nr:cyclopropane-fatty-acyl-phospholipid synthase family protein [Amycolatopsis acidiphila]TVT22572.1 class I SAM-dependent methyltransferase [Amycolatopsis acidiphila]UIJ58792.1 cyclopropane-fatty-acyl-phospholipid synthase family protein [Amycolatopsis acidiphila]GHG71982.1 cyclopropane-fatty-acyl-phospholipid synthase [Amycolatopsis acidiphila]
MTTVHTPCWPETAIVPDSPARAWAAERLFRLATRTVPVTVTLPGGERFGAGGPELRIERPRAFFHRLGADAKIGFGESYMAGDWSASELADVLTPFASRLATLVPKPLQVLRRFVDARKPSTERNTVSGARQNIHRHYDLSNELFAEFLDETMTYSSAWFEDGSEDLASAQRRKIDAILDLAGVRDGTRLLEIGTGWGGLALRAAERGARVTTLTISTEQQTLARKRLAEAGVGDRVDVVLRDYREAEGSYDAVASVEMIEAVGEEYWPAYFAALDRLLAPGGRVGLQGITMPHDRMLATRRSYTWIHKYVFPGGHLMSVEAFEQAVRRHTSLRIRERRSLGDSYAQTLRLWRKRFLDAWPQISALGFDQTFRRMWEFYLAYSEAGFRGEYLDVHQFGLTKPR